MSRALAVGLVVGASACAEFNAVDVELLVPDEVALHWDRSFNGEADDRVALVPVDLMVYQTESGEPVAGVALQVLPGFQGVQVVPFDDVVPVESEACDVQGCLWDAWRDRYVDVLDGGQGALATDDNGLARAWLVVDALPESPFDGFDAVPVLVSMGATEASFQLVPQ